VAPLAKKVRDPALVRCFSAQSFPLTPARDNNDLLNSALRLSLLCFFIYTCDSDLESEPNSGRRFIVRSRLVFNFQQPFQMKTVLSTQVYQ